MYFPIYHKIPDNMQGETLYPLYELEKQYPDIFEKEKKKYEHRPHVFNAIIPGLNCKWNDVIHFTAIHPREVQAALNKMGVEFKGKFFVFDINNFDKKKTIVYLNTAEDREQSKLPEQFEQFNDSHKDFYRTLSERQIKAYQEDQNEKGYILLYNRSPHIFFRGSVSIENVTIIEI